MTAQLNAAWARAVEHLSPSPLSGMAVRMATFAIVILSLSPTAALDLPTYAYDGDNIMLAGQDYRLEAVDAFEDGQRCQAADGSAYDCGTEAKMALQAKD